MALSEELKKFENESTFIDQFLIPLLHRIGFSVVVNYHGSREFGKDIVVGYIDQFGHVVYQGVQAKFERSISLGSIESVIKDANQSFNNPFNHPQTGSNERISTFYFANAGSISEEARTHFFNSLSNPLGGNVRLLDGKALVYLDRWATFNRGQFVIERLSALLFEIRNNNLFSVRIENFLEEYISEDGSYPMHRLVLADVMGYLETPAIYQSILSINDVQAYYRQCSMFNAVIDSAGVSFGSKEFRIKRVESAIKLAPKIRDMGKNIDIAISRLLAELGRPLAGL